MLVAATLSQRELNRAALARQQLLGRVERPLPDVLDAMGGLQAQYAPAMYVGLWSRVEGFERAQLDTALEDRSVVQGTLLRGTIHLVSAADYWPLATAIREPRRRWFLGVRRGMTAAAMDSRAAELRALLAAGPRSRKELAAAMDGDWEGLSLWVDQVRVPPSGTWARRRADLYGLASSWLGDDGHGVSESTAREHLVRRYLTGFGPASVKELATWAGAKVADLTPAVEALALERFRAEDGTELVDLPGASRPPADAPAPVRFLGVWDALLLVHARRKGVLAEEHRSRVFTTKNPQSVNTVLVDGEVAGTWRYRDGRIDVEPWRAFDGSTKRAVADEAGRLAELYR